MIDLSLRILSIMAPSILLASIGVAWKKFGPEYPTAFVTTLVLDVAMPALVFHTLLTTQITLDALKVVAMATLFSQIILFIMSATVLRIWGKEMSLAVGHVVGNTGNLGLPLCLFAFGQEGLAFAITFFSIQCLLLFTFGDTIYAGSVNITRMLKTPILYAIVAAFLVKLLALPVPPLIVDTAGLLGQIVVPIMLITLGVSISGMKAENLSSTVKWSLLRTALAACAAWATAEIFTLEGIARGVVILQTVVPVAVFNFLLARRHSRNSTEVSGLILVTHILALLYLPLILAYIL